MKNKIILLLIIILAIFLRLYKLDQIPPSLYWDEASLGYNAYAISTASIDEHGEKYPITRFIAFGDYKPPGYIYSIIPFYWIFGVSEFAIRMPSALSGIIMVIIVYLLIKQFFGKTAGLIGAFLTSISPWSLQLSRAAFEGHLGALFNLLGIYFFIQADKKKWLYPLSIISFILSFYTFNANRVLAPLVILFLGIIYFKKLWQAKIWVIISIIIGLLMFLPSLSYIQTREAKLRFDEVSIFTNLDIIKKSNERIERNGNTLLAKIIHNRRIYFAREFCLKYLDHFKGEYLFITGDKNPRLSIQSVGEMYLFELPFFVIGLISLIRLIKNKNKFGYLLLGWLILAPIPAAVARETPHMLRTASILPAMLIINSIGAVKTFQYLQNQKNKIYKLLLVFFSIFIIGNIYYYFHNYYAHYSVKWSGQWQYGYKQMVIKVLDLEKNYDRVSITSNYGRPYIYFLLYGKVNPYVYLKDRIANRDWYGFWEVDRFGKFDFKEKPRIENERLLIVKTPGAFASSGKKIDEIKDLEGNVIFEIGEP